MFSRPNLRRSLKTACYEAERIYYETGSQRDKEMLLGLYALLERAKEDR